MFRSPMMGDSWSSRSDPPPVAPMLTIFNIVLPVFLVVGAGYAAAKFDLIAAPTIDGLMKFAQTYAIPCLLFLSIYRLDLGVVFDAELIASFYIGAGVCFFLGVIGARRIFGRRPGESISIGFAALFSNSVLLGLAVTESAYGLDALAPNYLLIALHAPFCYFLGITAMELARADGRTKAETARIAFIAMFKNPITFACGLGFAFNLSGLPVPQAVGEAGDLLARSGLPLALFGLGGVISRYRITSALGEAGFVTVVSTMIHPTITYALAVHVFAMSDDFTRSAVIMSAMAPGVNAYVFASMYDRAVGAVATTVIISTLFCVATASFWLWMLGGGAL